MATEEQSGELGLFDLCRRLGTPGPEPVPEGKRFPSFKSLQVLKIEVERAVCVRGRAGDASAWVRRDPVRRGRWAG
jgi:hypothetical protein